MNPIEIRQVRKSYGSTEVLHGIDLSVSPGSLTGFLGPNGAGKSTTIRILMGLIRSTSGIATVFDKPVWRMGHRIRAEVGYLPGEVRFHTNWTGRTALNFFAGARRRNCRQEIDRLARQFDLDLSRTIRKYSSGMKQKLGLIQAMMHRPQLLVLDEPTNGLDPLVRKTLFQELREIVDQKRTVLFSSHTLSEVEELCDAVVILRDGHVIEQESIRELRRRALRRVEIRFVAGTAPSDSELPEGLVVLRRDSDSIVGTWGGSVPDLLGWLSRCPVDDVIVERPGLEDLFMTYYTDSRIGSQDWNQNGPNAQKGDGL